jgi:hypothetical protein
MFQVSKMKICPNWLICRCQYSHVCDHSKPHSPIGGLYGCNAKDRPVGFPCDIIPRINCQNYSDNGLCPRRKYRGCIDVEDDDLS